MDLEIEAIKTKVTELKAEHRLLDEDIRRLEEGGPFNPIEMQRLKRRKLALKDLLARLESRLLPDIIA